MSYVTRTPLSRSKGQSSRSPGRFTYRRVNALGSCSGEFEMRPTATLPSAGAAVGSAALYIGASAPTEGGEGRDHVVAAARLQLVFAVFDVSCRRYKLSINWSLFYSYKTY